MPITNTWSDPSAAGTLDLATGSVINETWTDKLASNFLWLGGTTGRITQMGHVSGSTLNPTTGATALVDLPDLSVTLTTTGGDVLVFTWSLMSSNVANNPLYLGIAMDAADFVSTVMTPGNAGSSVTITMFYRFTGISAASHIWKSRWATQTGTATAVGNTRYLLAVEVKR